VISSGYLYNVWFDLARNTTCNRNYSLEQSIIKNIAVYRFQVPISPREDA